MRHFTLFHITLTGALFATLTAPVIGGVVACTAEQTQHVPPPELQLFQADFGYALAIRDDLMVVGSPTSGSVSSGIAYVFQRDADGQWSFVEELQSVGIAGGDLLGTWVEIADGPAILVGAPGEDGAVANSGAIFLFTPTAGAGGSAWEQTLQITPAEGIDAGDRFGQVFAGSGEDIVVGVPEDDDAGSQTTNPGCVFFGSTAPGAAFFQRFPSDGQAIDVTNFGFSVDIDGDTAIVGAPFEGFPTATNFGQAYIYERDPKTNLWSTFETNKITPDDPEFNAQFGIAVALQGDRAFVGAHFKDEGATANNRGAVYVFERHEGGKNNWGQVQKILPAGVIGNISDHKFGRSIAVDGDTLVVMAAGIQFKAYVYHRQTNTAGGGDEWVEVAVLDPVEPPDTSPIIPSGADPIVLSGATAVLGYRNHSYVDGSDGSVFIFQGVDTTDCNRNGTVDICDLSSGASFDANSNGVPDECEQLCPADIVSSATFQPPPDGIVDGADLAYLLGEWGEVPRGGSLADIVTSATFQPPPDGVVDGADLAFLLGAWGVCE